MCVRDLKKCEASLSVLIVVCSLFVAVPSFGPEITTKTKAKCERSYVFLSVRELAVLGMPTSQKVRRENLFLPQLLSYLLRWREKKGDPCLLFTKLRKVGRASDERITYDSREPQRRINDHFTQLLDMCFLREFYNFLKCIGKLRKEN